MSGWSRSALVQAGRSSAALALALVLVAAVVAAVGGRGLGRVAENFFLLCGLVVALQVFMGNSGIVSFGHVAFFGTGAYVAAILAIPPQIKTDLLPSLPPALAGAQLGLAASAVVAALAAALLALLTGLALSRMQETAMAMATLALLVITHTTFANWEGVTRGTAGILGVPSTLSLPIAVAGAVLISGAALLFKASLWGLQLQAARDDRLAAQSLGVDVPSVRLAGWTVSALLMGAGGALWAHNNLAFGPDQFYYAETFTLLSMLVIGGLRSVAGAVAGTAVVTVASEAVRTLEDGIRLGPLRTPELPGVVQLSVAVLIMLVLVFRPQGLFGGRELWEARWRRR